MTTKDILAQYVDACKLIDETRADIEKLRKKQTAVLTDKVQASNPDFPYQPISVTIEGAPNLFATDHALRIREAELLRRIARCETIRTEAEQVINTAPPRIMRIIRLRYFLGYSWDDTARQVGGGLNAETARKQLENYLRKK